MTTLAALTTPCLLLEDEKLQTNMDRLAAACMSAASPCGPISRPARISRSPAAAWESPSGPATVSTLAEAEYFAAGGVHDICYAVGIAPNKLERVAELRRRGIDLSVVLDNEERRPAAGGLCPAAGLPSGRAAGDRLRRTPGPDCAPTIPA